MGTDCGIYRYRYFDGNNPTWGNWTQVVDIATLQTLGGVNFSSMSMWEIDDSLDAPGHMCGVFGAILAGIPAWHGLGFVYTSDYFDTIDRVLYITSGLWGPGSYLPGNWRSGVSMVQGSGGSDIYASTPYDMILFNKQVWKTTNHGAAWGLQLSNCGRDECLIRTPYINQTDRGKYVYSSSNSSVAVSNHYSEDGGATWGGMGLWGTRPMRLEMSPHRSDLLHYIGWSNWAEWRAGVHTILNPLHFTTQGRDVLVLGRNDDEEIEEAVLVGIGSVGGWIHLWYPTEVGALPAVGSVEGNINTVTGGSSLVSVSRFNYGFPEYA
jgi:hypothetical protein